MSTLRETIKAVLMDTTDRDLRPGPGLEYTISNLESAVRAWMREQESSPLDNPVVQEHNRRVMQGQARREPGF